MSALDNVNGDQFTGPEVWRGLSGENAGAAAEAHRRGEAGLHTAGKVHVTDSITHASTYAQRYQGDTSGVLMRGHLHANARPDELGMVDATAVRWDPRNYTLGQAYKIDDERRGYEYPEEHYRKNFGENWNG